jgi:restriction endonuclease HindI-like protein
VVTLLSQSTNTLFKTEQFTKQKAPPSEGALIFIVVQYCLMREAQSRGDKLKMSDEEIAFYDALEVNDSAVRVLGDDTLRQIALELVDAVRKNASISHWAAA